MSTDPPFNLLYVGGRVSIKCSYISIRGSEEENHGRGSGWTIGTPKCESHGASDLRGGRFERLLQWHCCQLPESDAGIGSLLDVL